MTVPPASMTWLAVALAVLAGPLARDPSLAALIGLVTGGAAAWGLGRLPAAACRYCLPAGVAVAALLLAASPSAALGPWGRWFSPADGLFFWNPVLWLGLAGAAVPAGRPSAGAALLVAAAWTFTAPGSAAAAVLASVALGVLVPALAAALTALAGLAAARPLSCLGGAGLVLVAWNFLFMEQYRRNLIPRDDTVSFVEVAGTNAALFERAFGAPATWPASWIFAARHGVSPSRYGATAAGSWQLEARDTEVVEPVSAKEAVFVALRAPKLVDVALDAAGHGTLELVVNGQRAATIPLNGSGEIRVRVAHSFWRRGVNEVRVEPAAGTEVSLRRLVLRRVGGAA